MTFSIDYAKFDELIYKTTVEKAQVQDVLSKARDLKGLSFQDVAALLAYKSHDLDEMIFDTANFVKTEIYGHRIVLFAPLYNSNYCSNNCLYCAFKTDNESIARVKLNLEELKRETEVLINEGHKRVLLVSGETSPEKDIDYILDSIDAVYSVKTEKGKINRINVNVAPLSIPMFKRLAEKKIGTYQLFQETYHEKAYKKFHVKGLKSDYRYRLDVMDRALQAGLQDVGIGALFGLYDWRFEVLATIAHSNYLEDTYGVGPHTISVPRIESAVGLESIASELQIPTDYEFKKIIAILRMAVPYTGIILSTRETKEMRREALHMGVSQFSAGSITSPGGYSQRESTPQFEVGDHRSLAEVIDDLVNLGHVPSFCTGCYRRGRVGKDFMDLAKPGLIKQHCLPNALFSFNEYLNQFATSELKEKGKILIKKLSTDCPGKEKVLEKLSRIDEGECDQYF